MGLNFSEWQAQQGGGTPAPSFAQWQQQQQAPAAAPAADEKIPPKLGGIWRYQGRGESVAGPRVGQNESGQFDIPAETLADLRSDDPEMQRLIDQGVLTRYLASPASTGVNEGGEFNNPAVYRYNLDYSKLPQTKYGSLMDVRQMDTPSGQAVGGFKLKDPNAKYYDPNYGWITSSQNTIDPSSQRDWHDLIGPVVMGAVLGGAGMGLLGPVGAGQGLGLSLGRAGMGFLQSGGKNLAGLASAAAGATGIPFAGQAAGLLVNSLQGNKVNPVQAGLGVAPSFAGWLAQQAGG